jgi:hypothetical protein
MPESLLSITLSELKRAVAVLLGWPRDPSEWDNTIQTDFEDIHKRALRMFYFPPTTGIDRPTYEWTFLRKTGTITLQNEQWRYDLPSDFGGTILDSSTAYPAGTNHAHPRKVDEQEIRQLRMLDDLLGVPRYYAVRPKNHDSIEGQRWEFIVYPTPDASEHGLSIQYRYVHVPDSLVPNGIYPVGGAQYSEVILAAHLSAAEYMLDDDGQGPFTAKFNEMLQAAMRNDENQKKNRGEGTE